MTEKREKSDRHIGPSDPTPLHTKSSDSTPHSRPEDGHKRHDEPVDSTRHDRKRKRESSDDEKDGLELKKARTMEDSGKKRNRDGTEEGEDSGKKRKKDGAEGEDVNKKRRKDGGEEAKIGESESQRQPSSSDDRRATAKDVEVVSGDRRSRGQDSALGRRAREKDRKVDGAGTASSDSEGEGAESQKTEWSSLPSLLLEFPLPKAVLPLERFSPAAVLMGSGVSPYLAGPELYQKAVEMISVYLKAQHPTLPQAVVNEPFGPPSFGSTGATYLESQLELANTYVECGMRPSCRALTTSMDCAVRGKLKKYNSKVLLPSQTPTSWDASGHYKTSISLYRAAGGSSSNFKLKESVVGSVLVVR